MASAGGVLVFRGWMGRSPGLDPLAERLRAEGIAASVFSHEQADAVASHLRAHPPEGPVVLVGHSWGADRALALAGRLGRAGIPVALVVTLDPNTPPRVPANVARCRNYFQTEPGRAWLPAFRGVPLEAEAEGTDLANLAVRDPALGLWEEGTDHFTITTNARVQDAVVADIRGALRERR